MQPTVHRSAFIARVVIFLSVIVLASCGGGGGGGGGGTNPAPAPAPSTFSIGGSVQGLNGSLALSLSAGATSESITVSADGSFTFTNEFQTNTQYTVTITSAPSNQICSLSGGTGTVSSSDVTDIQVTCSTQNATSTLSGSISIAANTQFDSDVNDPFAPFADNNVANTAQLINNRSTVHGFATKDPTGNEGDRFNQVADAADVYRVTLQAGQSIRLQVVDFESFDNDDAFSGDLDLYLFDQDLAQVAFSIEVTEFEQITVPETAEYFILVDAFSGASKYVLSISDSGSSTAAPARSPNFVPNQAIVQLAQEPSSAKSSLAPSIKLSADTTTRPVLADFSDTLAAASTDQSGFELELASRNPDSLAKLRTLRQIKQLNHTPGVAIAEPNYIRTSQLAPNDEFYGLQWHYPAMNLPQAWDITTGTPTTGSVIVAVVDTGVFLAHPDLADKLVPGYDFISDASTALDGDGIDPNPDDPGDAAVPGSSSWHGTHVAGTVAADTNNDIGVAGVSWGAEIMPLRVLGRSGQGTDFDILQAVLFAAGLPNDSGTLPAQRADIINLSLGGPGQSATSASVYQQVVDSGVIVVAAAGNESTSSPSFPAAYDGVISVAALDANDELAPYSNFGSTLDLAAPGGNVAADLTGDGQPDGVLSTIVDDSSGQRQATLSFYQGTSMAAPHAAGVLALMKAVYPELAPADVDTLLQTGAITRDAGDPGFDSSFGWGILDALMAVQAAQALANGGTLPEQPPAIVATPAAVNLSTLTTAVVNLENRGGGAPVFVSVDSGAPWLSVTDESVDAAGLGSYRLDVDRTDLEDGFYSAIATFTFSDAITLSLSVSMQVGNAQTDGVVSELYILLVNADDDTSVSQVQVTPVAGLASGFTFEDVADGTYFIFAGSDIDNDVFICQFGEACGSYPSVNDPLIIEVNGASQTNLNFVVDILSGLTSFSTNSDSGSRLTNRGIRRKTSSTKERELPGSFIKPTTHE